MTMTTDEQRELTQIKASLEVLARAAVVAIIGQKLTRGEAYDDLVNALNLPRVQDALSTLDLKFLAKR